MRDREVGADQLQHNAPATDQPALRVLAEVGHGLRDRLQDRFLMLGGLDACRVQALAGLLQVGLIIHVLRRELQRLLHDHGKVGDLLVLRLPTREDRDRRARRREELLGLEHRRHGDEDVPIRKPVEVLEHRPHHRRAELVPGPERRHVPFAVRIPLVRALLELGHGDVHRLPMLVIEPGGPVEQLVLARGDQIRAFRIEARLHVVAGENEHQRLVLRRVGRGRVLLPGRKNVLEVLGARLDHPCDAVLRPLLNVRKQRLHLAERRGDADHHAVSFPEIAHAGREEADVFPGQDFIFEAREPFARGFRAVFGELTVVGDEAADGVAGARDPGLGIDWKRIIRTLRLGTSL